MNVACLGRGAPLAATIVTAGLVGCTWFGLADPTRSQQHGPPPGPAGSFGEDHAWDDGKAELSIYDAEEIVEGEKRRFEAVSIVVAELLDPKQMVKKEQFSLSYVPVLKYNWFLRIPAGIYSYQQMATLLMRRSDMLVMKAVFSSQDWCGATFQEWRRDDPMLRVHSYWDGEADASYELPEPSEMLLFQEELPLWVRSRRPERARSEKIALIEKRLGAKAPPPVVTAAVLAFLGVKEGEGGKRIEVELQRGEKRDLFVLSPAFPFSMLEWRRADGTAWKLEKTTRLDYWKYSKSEFAGYLEK